MLFYFFGFTVFSIFVNSKIQTTVLAWHDMFAHVLESDLLYYNLTTLLQPVLWSYAEDLDLYLPRSTWASLQVGKNIIPIFSHPKFIQFARFSSWNFKYRYLKILFSLKLKSIKTTQSKFCICHMIDSNQLHFTNYSFVCFSHLAMYGAVRLGREQMGQPSSAATPSTTFEITNRGPISSSLSTRISKLLRFGYYCVFFLLCGVSQNL